MTNRLAHSQSLYLRKHAENPIDWYPWGEEALEKASRENKPIFLSIGYSSCHWCTVMEGEAFSDGTIADYMNQFFVPIKVDREERPDLDSIYMQALQMMTGQGGWPLNVFLTPHDRIPFYGGTYFPLDPKYGRPGFLQLLQAIRQFHDTEAEKLQSRKETILAQLQQGTRLQPGEELSDTLLRQGLVYSAGIITASGMGQSFPMIPYAEAALRAARFNFPESRYDALVACKQRGLNLSLGGIFDHVGGGFHRYTVDPTWTVPHFEKMLYDNGQIVEFLANLWALGVKEPAFERAIAKTVGWLKREMLAPQGYFYAAQDADSFITPDDAEPEEGAFYVWNHVDLQQILSSAELDHLAEYFIISEGGNFEGNIVLQRRTAELGGAEIEAILAKLFAIRYGHVTLDRFPPAHDSQEAKTTAWDGRIPPVTDTKMIVAWNSLMISGLARAAAVFQSVTPELTADCLHLATQVAQFILDNQWVEGRFHRLNYDGQPAILAQSEDYALFIKALLDLNQALLAVQTDAATPLTASVWLQHALRIQEEFDEFLSSLEGGYYNTDARSDLVVRERSYDDNATPSANGVAIANLVRLAFSSENLSYLDRAEQALRAFSGIMQQTPQVCPTLFVALDWFRNHTLVRTSADLISQLSSSYLPTVVYTSEPDLPADAVGLVCEGLSCQEPAQSIEQLREQLDRLQARE